MKYEVGNYVRVKTDNEDNIVKIVKIDNDIEYGTVFVEHGAYSLKKFEMNNFNTSKKIIDMVEIGDYVNGIEVTHVNNYSAYNYLILGNDKENRIYNKDIKTVCTKRNFNEVNYIVE